MLSRKLVARVRAGLIAGVVLIALPVGCGERETGTVDGEGAAAVTGCTANGVYPEDGEFAPVFLDSPPYMETEEWLVEKQSFEDAWSTVDLDALDLVYAPDVLVHHTPFKSTVGPEAVKTGINGLHLLLPDLTCILDDGIRDQVVVRDEQGHLATKAVLYTVSANAVLGPNVQWTESTFRSTSVDASINVRKLADSNQTLVFSFGG